MPSSSKSFDDLPAWVRYPLYIAVIAAIKFYWSKEGPVATVVGGLLILVLIFVCGFLFVAIYTFLHRSLTTVGRKMRDEGIVGVGKALNDSLLAPILYGKKGRPRN